MVLDTVHLADTGPPIGKTLRDSLHIVFEGKNIKTWIDGVQSRELRDKYQMFVEFKAFPFLDDLFLDKQQLDLFNNFIIDWMENQQTERVYSHFMFRIHSNSISFLEDCGFLEWLFYTLLICKSTRVNIILIIDGKSFDDKNAPIICNIVRDFSDPRLNIAIEGTFLPDAFVPEDLGIYTIMLIGNKFDCDCTQKTIGENENRFVISRKNK